MKNEFVIKINERNLKWKDDKKMLEEFAFIFNHVYYKFRFDWDVCEYKIYRNGRFWSYASAYFINEDCEEVIGKSSFVEGEELTLKFELRR